MKKFAYKYRGGRGLLNENHESFFDRDVNTLVHNQIYCPTLDKLNDPTEGMFDDQRFLRFLDTYRTYSKDVSQIYNQLLQKFKKVGVYSLSESYDNELLWAYYGAAHKGFVIEYDLEKFMDYFNYNPNIQQMHVVNVDYVNRLPELCLSDFGRDIQSNLIQKCLATKSKQWQHEKEVRVISDNAGLIDIDYRSVTAIYFGCRMSDREIDYLMNQLRGRGLKYYRMQLVDSSYWFVPIAIKDKYKDASVYSPNSVAYDIDQLIEVSYLSDDEISRFKGKFIKILESLKSHPLVKNFYLLSVMTDDDGVILQVFANLKKDFPPIRGFKFRLEGDQIKEIIP